MARRDAPRGSEVTGILNWHCQTGRGPPCVNLTYSQESNTNKKNSTVQFSYHIIPNNCFETFSVLL